VLPPRSRVSSRGRRQSVADLDDFAIGGSFESNATYSQPFGSKPDLVVAEGTLVAVLLGSVGFVKIFGPTRRHGCRPHAEKAWAFR